MDQRTAPVSLIDDALGWQDLTIGATRIYVLPSTSPNARWQWEQHKWHWRALAAAAPFL